MRATCQRREGAPARHERRLRLEHLRPHLTRDAARLALACHRGGPTAGSSDGRKDCAVEAKVA